ncbi:10624_t:CDS:2 [Diversispora eburnea]|uniref:10624_t:CDS:1 n=1 Tax=Diversispora eburnea TaxID=1213867 RepID=A0A9N8Z594_9GLOM|nr:10624_t:CDS:2 [Diversispora eburnea]
MLAYLRYESSQSEISTDSSEKTVKEELNQVTTKLTMHFTDSPKLEHFNMDKEGERQIDAY